MCFLNVAILVMAHYRSGAGKRYTPDSVWALGSLACKLAQSVSQPTAGIRCSDPLTIGLLQIGMREYFTLRTTQKLTRNRPRSCTMEYGCQVY